MVPYKGGFVIMSLLFFCVFSFFVFGVDAAPLKKIVFATSVDYPPFEYFSNGELKGFDVELAQAVAKELQAEYSFRDMNFSNILASIDNNAADAGIACCSATPERAKHYDFSDEFHRDRYAIIFKEGTEFNGEADLQGKHVAVQVGTTMALWLKSHAPKAKRDLYDTNIMAVESLRSGKVDGVLVEASQAKQFCSRNKGLRWKDVGQADHGFAIVLPKGSPLKEQINAAIRKLKNDGTLRRIAQKYLS